MLLIELDTWEDEWLDGIQALQGEKKTKKLMKRKNDLKNDIVCGQIINICKLGANWNGQNLKNHRCRF